MGGEFHSGFVVKSDGVQDGGCDHGRFERGDGDNFETVCNMLLKPIDNVPSIPIVAIMRLPTLKHFWKPSSDLLSLLPLRGSPICFSPAPEHNGICSTRVVYPRIVVLGLTSRCG